ncbi:unnamed protein product [Musa textilis]
MDLAPEDGHSDNAKGFGVTWKLTELQRWSLWLFGSVHLPVSVSRTVQHGQ